MNNPPYSFNEINMYNAAVQPSTVHVRNTASARFFKRYLLQEAFSPFKITLPNNWIRDYFLYVVYVIGNIGVIRTDKYGIIPQHGTPSGYTVQYQPDRYIIANPLLRTRADGYIIDEECSVIKLQPDWCGLYDIVDFYGDMMALTAEAAGVNILNSHMAYVFGAKTKAQAETLKKLYDNVAGGEPAQFVDKELFDDEGHLNVTLFTQNVGQNFIADKMLDVLLTLRKMFLTQIGIPNANTEKKERLITDEVAANNFETRSKCEIWLETLQTGFKQTRELFGIPETDLNVDWRDDLKGGVTNGNSVNPFSI